MSYEELARIAIEVAATEKIVRLEPEDMRERILQAEAKIAKLRIVGMPSPEVLPFLLVMHVVAKLRRDAFATISAFSWEFEGWQTALNDARAFVAMTAGTPAAIQVCHRLGSLQERVEEVLRLHREP